MDGTVTNDEDVQQRLANAPPVLHLPARRVILPHVQRIVHGLGPLVDVDLLLLVVPVLPPEVLRLGDQLPPTLVVHEPTQLGLDHLLNSLGAALGECFDKKTSLLEVCESVERTIIFCTGSSNNPEDDVENESDEDQD